MKAHADKWHRAGGNWFKVLSICDEVRLGRGLRSVYIWIYVGSLWIYDCHELKSCSIHCCEYVLSTKLRNFRVNFISHCEIKDWKRQGFKPWSVLLHFTSIKCVFQRSSQNEIVSLHQMARSNNQTSWSNACYHNQI